MTDSRRRGKRERKSKTGAREAKESRKDWRWNTRSQGVRKGRGGRDRAGSRRGKRGEGLRNVKKRRNCTPRRFGGFNIVFLNLVICEERRWWS